MGRNAREPNAWSRTVATTIKVERLASGLSHTQFYEAAGITRSTYFKLLSGDLVVDIVQVDAIARVLGMRASELVRLAEARQSSR